MKSETLAKNSPEAASGRFGQIWGGTKIARSLAGTLTAAMILGAAAMGVNNDTWANFVPVKSEIAQQIERSGVQSITSASEKGAGKHASLPTGERKSEERRADISGKGALPSKGGGLLSKARSRAQESGYLSAITSQDWYRNIRAPGDNAGFDMKSDEHDILSLDGRSGGPMKLNERVGVLFNGLSAKTGLDLSSPEHQDRFAGIMYAYALKASETVTGGQPSPRIAYMVASTSLMIATVEDIRGSDRSVPDALVEPIMATASTIFTENNAIDNENNAIVSQTAYVLKRALDLAFENEGVLENGQPALDRVYRSTLDETLEGADEDMLSIREANTSESEDLKVEMMAGKSAAQIWHDATAHIASTNPEISHVHLKVEGLASDIYAYFHQKEDNHVLSSREDSHKASVLAFGR